ncbi:hypothetical protein LIER_14983 [Lithospermum erythrorhizon]|uniref:Uncharacterized protein n=1 Tax=Lithospermum erythrorhizon TaxID=34254 RepID=A0AAV3Q312_LITER
MDTHHSRHVSTGDKRQAKMGHNHHHPQPHHPPPQPHHHHPGGGGGGGCSSVLCCPCMLVASIFGMIGSCFASCFGHGHHHHHR